MFSPPPPPERAADPPTPRTAGSADADGRAIISFGPAVSTIPRQLTIPISKRPRSTTSETSSSVLLSHRTCAASGWVAPFVNAQAARARGRSAPG